MRAVAMAAALILLVADACAPNLPTIEGETVPQRTQALLSETETPPIQRQTPAVSSSTSQEPTATPKPSPQEDGSGDATAAAPTETSDSGVERVRGAEEAIAAATADLAQRLGVAEGDVIVESVAPVLWPDTSLGCPEPGAMYLQVMTPGYLILFEVGAETYRYHTDDAGRVVLCPSDAPAGFPPIPMNPKEIDDGTPWVPVD